MSRSLSAAKADKLISEWTENHNSDDEGVESADSSDASNVDNVEIDDISI